jgi:hypothetical protein
MSALTARFLTICSRLYVQHAGLVGALYCALPAVTWFVLALLLVPFRPVYGLRLVLSLVVGCPIGAYINRQGVAMWLAKHREPSGPAGALDGALVGASVGIGTALLPTLILFLISSSDVDRAKGFVILTYLAAAAVGAANGAVLGAVGRRYLERS